MKHRRMLLGLLMHVALCPVGLWAGTNVWQGKSTKWNATENWSGGAVPKGADEIVIPAGCAHYPVLTKEITVAGTLTIRKGARLVSEKNVKVAAGKLHMEAGGEILLGVVRKDGKVIDTTLRVVSAITPATCPVITPAPVPEMQPSVVRILHNHVGPQLPVDIHLTNIAPFASIRVVPYMTVARTLVDQDEELRTVGIPERGRPANGVRYEFHYDTPQTIAEIRWAVVNGPWAIQADTNGDGLYDTLLRADFEGRLTNPGGIWRSRSWVHNTFSPPVQAYGIQIASLLAKISDNRLYDVQILCPPDTVRFKRPALQAGVAEMQAGNAVNVPVPPLEAQFLKGFHIEPWMFNVLGWIKANRIKDQKQALDRAKKEAEAATGTALETEDDGLELEDGEPKKKKPKPRPRATPHMKHLPDPKDAALEDSKAFLAFAKAVKGFHANVVNMWPPKTFEKRGKGTYESDLLWPSQYDRHSVRKHYLKAICDAFHKQGIKVFTMLRCPYPKKLEAFPKTDTSAQKAPFINRHTREYLAGIVREQVAAGVDGVGIGYDEQGSWSIMHPKRADPFTRQIFAQRYKIPFPEKPDDTEAFRKWIVFAYEEWASYMKDAAVAAKTANPKVFTKTPTHVCLGTLWNARINVGIAEDIVGHIAPVDFARANCYEAYENLGHYKTTVMTKQTVAANPKGGADSLHNCPWANDPVKFPGYYLDTTPAYMYGPPIVSIMNGGSLPLYWRYNFIFYGGYDKYVKQAYAILDTLAAWGAKKAKPLRSIAVLRSRASEDWWQVRQRYNEKGDPLEQTRGYLYLKWLWEFLLVNGYPFDIYYLEHPEDFAEALSTYDLVILPFPYSIKKDTFNLLARKIEAGTKLVLFDRKGETDEWGRAYAEPLFSRFIAEGKVTFVDQDMPSLAYNPAVRRTMKERVDGLLGEHKKIHFSAYGHDVEVACLEKNAQEKILTVVNWASHPVVIDVGVSLPGIPGGYRVLQRDLKATREVSLNGRKVLKREDLRVFRLSLEKWEIKALYIAPAQDG